ncbi:MAG: asparagine synthase (glutamine-hydrolyzing) [bacterium]
MCGIAGQVSLEKIVKTENIGRMVRALRHRGPDDSGCWVAPSGSAVLGHARLSIIELSPLGHQPFISPDGQVALVFNGEIYNFQEIKKELIGLGYGFVSSSDTEVLLLSYLEWGENCVNRLNGMFAFVIWDDRVKKLFAARDRLGEKPFKYCVVGNDFIFASEIKSLLEFPGVKREVDWSAVDLAMSLRFVPAGSTGFKNIHKLPAGHVLTWQDGEMNIRKYWEPSLSRGLEISDYTTVKKEVWSLFKNSVEKRLISDVSVGAFLSGGIDSTSVVAAMSEVGCKNINTYVISMNGVSDDQRFAKLAANYYGTNHYEIELNDIDYQAATRDVAKIYDEPFFDQSALPSLLINREIKKNVSVVLSGDGGDELFGGYEAYRYAGLLKTYQRLPGDVIKKALPGMPFFSNDFKYKMEILNREYIASYSEYYSLWKNHLPVSKKFITKEDLYLREYAEKINRNLLQEKFSEWFDINTADIRNASMIADFKGRLSDGYLAKVDFASMASAAEVRAPFLDYRLVELALRIPSRYKIKNRQTKYIWKDIISDKLPREIINRPKMGFSIPLHLIIKDQLSEMVHDLVLSPTSRISAVYSNDIINKMWQDHCGGRADYSNHLWSLLMLELWLRNYQVN